MRLMRFKRINIEVVLKMIILLGFAFFFYRIIKTGEILLYVNPRIIPYIEFGIVSMVLLSLFIALDILKPNRKANIMSYLFFIVPLFLAFAVPVASVNSSEMSLSSVKSKQEINSVADQSKTTDNSIVDEGPTIESSTEDNNTTTDNSAITTQSDSNGVDAEFEIQNNTILMNDNNFLKWLQEISDNMKKYENKKIELVGFVFKNDQFKENEFVPARFLMSCCTADMQPVGLLCHYDKAKDLKQDTWVIVKGKIEILDYNGEKTPVIIAESIKNTEKPKNDYVYPF